MGGGSTRQTRSAGGFDFSDLFSGFSGGGYDEPTPRTREREEESLDVTNTVIVPIFDLILGTKVDVETVYGKHLSLMVKEGTKPGTRFRIAGKGRKTGNRTGDMFVVVEAKMPKTIPDDVRKLLESIKYRL